MQKYNLIKYFTSCVSLVVIGCSLPSPQKSSSSAATFVVDKVNANFTSVETQTTFALPVAKTLSIEVCLSDAQYSKPIIGHKFIIKGGTQDQEATTDGTGCMLWKDEVRYDHLTNAAYVEIQRELVAHGFQKGSRTISLAVNPWETKVLSFKDSNDSSVGPLVPHSLAVQKLSGIDSQTGKTERHPILAKTMKLNVQQKEITPDGTNYSLEIQLDPKVYLKNADGTETTVSVGQGKFNAKVYLIHVSNKNVKKIMATSDIIPIEKSNSDTLTITTKLFLQETCTLGQYELGLELTPIDGPEGLASLSASYSIGTCESLIGKQFLSINNDLVSTNDQTLNFSIKSYAEPQDIVSTNANTDKSTNSNANNDSMQKTGIRITPITTIGRKIYITKSSYTKELRFNLNICIENSVDRNTIRSQTLQITGIGGKTLSARTANNGCAQFEDSIDFNYFAPECWKKSEIIIKNKTLGLDEKIPVEINPLVENWIFFQDLRYPAKIQDSFTNKCAQGTSEILASSFAFDTRDYNYSIDKFMGLKIYKIGNLRMQLSLNRPSLSNVRGADDLPLPVGKYRLRWAVVDMDVKDYSKATGAIYSIGEKNVSIKSNSTISEPITITMENIKAIGNINQILFEISPIGSESKGLTSKIKTATFRATTTLANKSDGSGLEVTPMDSVIPELIKQFYADQAKNKNEIQHKATKEYFAKNNSLTLVNLNNNQQGINNVNPNELDLWLRSGQMSAALKEQFCEHWTSDILRNLGVGYFSSVAIYHKCKTMTEEDPRKFFDTEFRYFVDKISSAKYLGGNFRDLSITNSFRLSYDHGISDGSGYSASVGISGSAGTPPIALVSASANASATYTLINHSDYAASESVNSIGIAAGVSATVETIPFEVKLSEYEKCAVIKINPALLITKNSPIQFEERSVTNSAKQAIARHGYLICQGIKIKRPFTYRENYYVINQNLGATQAMNAYSNQNRPFFISIRGRGDFVTFISITQNAFSIPSSFNSDYLQSQLLQNPLEPVFLRGLRTYPGQVITPAY